MQIETFWSLMQESSCERPTVATLSSVSCCLSDLTAFLLPDSIERSGTMCCARNKIFSASGTLLILTALSGVSALNNGVGKTPAMGWNRCVRWDSCKRTGYWGLPHQCLADPVFLPLLLCCHWHCSWNYFRCNINETLIKQVADAMVDSGLAAAGYK